jgi:hypothetical protein
MNIFVAIKREERKREKQFGKVAAPVNRLTCTADDLFIFSFPTAQRRRVPSHPSHKTTPTERHQACTRTVGRLQAEPEAAERNKRGVNMALTRDFRETVQARVKRDAAFRKVLL